jgi:hypothetical protein
MGDVGVLTALGKYQTDASGITSTAARPGEIGDAGDVAEACLSFAASMMTVRVNSRLLPSVSYAMFR